MNKENKENEIVSEKKETIKDLKYSKVELVSNERYLKYRDILNVLLKESEMYSFVEIDKIIEKFMKGKV